jgi:putative FmdB family regulatory protein
MPIYDYHCDKCNTIEEHLVKNIEEPMKCPTCEKEMERLITGRHGFILKGTGWYKTDFKHKR